MNPPLRSTCCSAWWWMRRWPAGWCADPGPGNISIFFSRKKEVYGKRGAGHLYFVLVDAEYLLEFLQVGDGLRDEGVHVFLKKIEKKDNVNDKNAFKDPHPYPTS